jgi:hypothetical protein
MSTQTLPWFASDHTEPSSVDATNRGAKDEAEHDLARVTAKYYQVYTIPPMFTIPSGTVGALREHLGDAGWYRFLAWGVLGFYEQPATEFAQMVLGLQPRAEVFGRVVNNALDLWVILERRDETAEAQVAQKACELMRSYPQLRFDFMVVDRVSEAAQTLSESGYSSIPSN